MANTLEEMLKIYGNNVGVKNLDGALSGAEGAIKRNEARDSIAALFNQLTNPNVTLNPNTSSDYEITQAAQAVVSSSDDQVKKYVTDNYSKIVDEISNEKLLERGILIPTNKESGKKSDKKYVEVDSLGSEIAELNKLYPQYTQTKDDRIKSLLLSKAREYEVKKLKNIETQLKERKFSKKTIELAMGVLGLIYDSFTRSDPENAIKMYIGSVREDYKNSLEKNFPDRNDRAEYYRNSLKLYAGETVKDKPLEFARYVSQIAA